MVFFLVHDSKVEAYNRVGGCNRCAACCGHQFKYVFSARNRDIPPGQLGNWWMAPEYDNSVFFYSQGLWWSAWTWRVEGERKMCPQFRPPHICAVWKKDLPAICRYWPVQPSDVKAFPQCSFRFTKISEANYDPRTYHQSNSSPGT